MQMLLSSCGQKLDPVVVCSTLLPLIASEDTLLSSVAMEALACLHKLHGPSQLQGLLRSAGASELLIATVLQANIQNFLPCVTQEGLVGHRLVPQRSEGGSELESRARDRESFTLQQQAQSQQQWQQQQKDEQQDRIFGAAKLPWEVKLPRPGSQDMSTGGVNYSSNVQGLGVQEVESSRRGLPGELGGYEGHSSGVSATALRAAVSMSGHSPACSEGGLADTLRAARSATAPQRLLHDLAGGHSITTPQQQQLVTSMSLLGLAGAARGSSSSSLVHASLPQGMTVEAQQWKKSVSAGDYHVDTNSSFKTQKELEAAGKK